MTDPSDPPTSRPHRAMLDTLPELVIPAGQAEVQLSAALAALAVALERVEALAKACARALDAQGKG
ncbi:MAG: hypothetical protein ABSC94_15290 [Polyangiaceae bacterium]